MLPAQIELEQAIEQNDESLIKNIIQSQAEFANELLLHGLNYSFQQNKVCIFNYLSSIKLAIFYDNINQLISQSDLRSLEFIIHSNNCNLKLITHIINHCIDIGNVEALVVSINLVKNYKINITNVLNIGILKTIINLNNKNKPAMLKALIEGGANPNAQDSFGEFPIQRAIDMHQYAAVLQLIESGAKLTSLDENCLVRLFEGLIVNNDPAMFEKFLSLNVFKDLNRNFENIFQQALKYCAFEIIGWVNSKINIDLNLELIKSFYTQETILSLNFLENLDNIGLLDYNCYITILKRAMQLNQRSVIGWLLIKQFDLPSEFYLVAVIPGAKKFNLLHYAAYTLDIELIKHAISLGIDINSICDAGPALLIADQTQFTIDEQLKSEVIRLLLSLGANYYISDKASNNVLNRRDENLQPIHFAAIHNAVSVIQEQLLNGIDVNIQSSTGQTALHYAVENNNIAAARFLLKNKADHKISNNLGIEPFDFLFTDEDVFESDYTLDFFKLFIEYDGDINKEYFGRTYLWWALENYDLSMTNLLIKNGADINPAMDIQSPRLDDFQDEVEYSVSEFFSKAISYPNLNLKLTRAVILFAMLIKNDKFQKDSMQIFCEQNNIDFAENLKSGYGLLKIITKNTVAAALLISPFITRSSQVVNNRLVTCPSVLGNIVSQLQRGPQYIDFTDHNDMDYEQETKALVAAYRVFQNKKVLNGSCAHKTREHTITKGAQ